MNADAARLSLSPRRIAYTRWAVAVAALALLFSWWLYLLTAFSVRNELYSHILLIPILSGYFVWLKRRHLPEPRAEASGLAIALGGIGALAGGALAIAKLGAITLPSEDELFLSTSGAILLFAAATIWLLGTAFTRRIAFPLAFLALTIPLPVWARDSFEVMLQTGSSYAAFAMFRVVGTPVYNDGFVFQLPGTTLEVAPECSGIHSTVALLVTSLVAGYLFLKSPWRRAGLAFVVVPIAIVRNGFRVFTLGELCVQFGPRMLDSPIHHHGGPIFFLLSVIPFCAVLVWLARSERPRAGPIAA